MQRPARPGTGDAGNRFAGARSQRSGRSWQSSSASFRFELLGSVAAEQEPRGIAFEAVADAAQVADQRAEFAQRRAQLLPAVVGEAAESAAVLAEAQVGAARGRVQSTEGGGVGRECVSKG